MSLKQRQNSHLKKNNKKNSSLSCIARWHLLSMWKLLIGTACCFLFVCAPPWFTGWQRRASGERQSVLTECSRALVTAGIPRAQWVTMNNESEMARALYSQLWSIDSNDDPADWLRLFDSSRHWVLCFPRWSDFILVLFFPPSPEDGVYQKLELWIVCLFFVSLYNFLMHFEHI